MASNKKNSFWLTLQYSTTLLLSFVNLKLNLLTFGGEVFAIWLILLSAWGLGGSLDLGFGLSVVKFTSLYKNDKEKLPQILGTALIFFIFFGLIIFFGTYLIGSRLYLLNRNLIPESYFKIAKLTFLVLGIHFYISYINNFFRSVFEGLSQFITITKINILCSIVLHISVIAIYLNKMTILQLSYASLINVFLNLFLSLFFYYRLFPNLRLHRLKFKLSILKEIFQFSFSIQITYLLGSLIDPVTKYIIGNYYDRSFVTIYEIAKKFSMAVVGVFNSAFKYAFTHASALTDENQYIPHLLSECVKISRFGQIFSALAFGFSAPFFLLIFHRFYGFQECLIIFLILALAESLNNVGFILYVFITGTGGVKYLAILQFLNITINSSLLYIGIRYFHTPYGLIGYFISCIIANFLMLRYIHIKTGLNIGQYYKSINIKKSIYLSLLFLLNILLLHLKILDYFYLQLIFSPFYFLMFIKEFNTYGMTLFKSFYKKKIN